MAASWPATGPPAGLPPGRQPPHPDTRHDQNKPTIRFCSVRTTPARPYAPGRTWHRADRGGCRRLWPVAPGRGLGSRVPHSAGPAHLVRPGNIRRADHHTDSRPTPPAVGWWARSYRPSHGHEARALYLLRRARHLSRARLRSVPACRTAYCDSPRRISMSSPRQGTLIPRSSTWPMRASTSSGLTVPAIWRASVRVFSLSTGHP